MRRGPIFIQNVIRTLLHIFTPYRVTAECGGYIAGIGLSRFRQSETKYQREVKENWEKIFAEFCIMVRQI